MHNAVPYREPVSMKCPHCGKLIQVNPAALLGSKGGAAGKGDPKRAELNRKAAAARWKDHPKKEKPNAPTGKKPGRPRKARVEDAPGAGS
jgi:hypothetical protein